MPGGESDADSPSWADEVDAIGRRSSLLLQEYCVALRHDDREFCEELIEIGTERTVNSKIFGIAAVDWSDELLRGAVVDAGREAAQRAMARYRAHQERVDMLLDHQLQRVLQTNEAMKKRWPASPFPVRKMGVDPTVCQVRLACYLLSTSQIDAVVAPAPDTIKLPQHISVNVLRRRLSDNNFPLAALSLPWLTDNVASVCWTRANAASEDRILCSPVRDHDGEWLNPDPIKNDDVLTAKDAKAVADAVRKHARNPDDGSLRVRWTRIEFSSMKLPRGVTLKDAAATVLERLGRPPTWLWMAVAKHEDATQKQLVLTALKVASGSDDRLAKAVRKSLFTRLDGQCRRILAVIADKFGVHVMEPHGGYVNYSSVTATALPLSAVPEAASTPLQLDARGFKLARDEWICRARREGQVARRRPDGECAAEAMDISTGQEAVGDAIEALKQSGAGGVSFHEMDTAVSHLGVRLYTLDVFEDGEALSFGSLLQKVTEGILVCEVEVTLECGGIGVHYVMLDCWRRVVCLGAGELAEEWLAGLAGFSADDVECQRIDEQLRTLRVVKLLGVRVVMFKAVDEQASKKRKLNGRQRWKKLSSARLS